MNRISCIRVCAALTALLVIGPFQPFEANGADGATSWPEVLLSENSTPDQRRRALEAVKSIATGEPDDPATREAIFALAQYWAGRSEEGGLGTEAIQALNTATALYLDDPRTPRLLRTLADALVAAGDHFGAHTAYRRLIGIEGDGDDDVALLSRAAVNAADAGDMAAALDWAQRADPDAVGTEERILLLLARTAAGRAMGRVELALDAIELLEVEAAETLHTNERALLAAAETLEAVGLYERAIPLFYRFVSVHPKARRRPYAMYKLGELYMHAGRAEHARAHWTWLHDAYPDSPEAHRARMEELSLGDPPKNRVSANRHIHVMGTAHTTAQGLEACRTFIDGFVGSGRPLIVAETLIKAVTPDPLRPYTELGRTVIAHCLEDSLSSVIGLLDARGDTISIAAISSRIHELGIEPKAEVREAIARARSTLGLPGAPLGALAEAIDVARDLIGNERWQEALAVLERARLINRRATAATIADAERLEIELLWRAGDDRTALERLDLALEREPIDPERRRALLVLLGDVRFADGRLAEACDAYRDADLRANTPWVTAQLTRCPPTTTAAVQASR